MIEVEQNAPPAIDPHALVPGRKYRVINPEGGFEEKVTFVKYHAHRFPNQSITFTDSIILGTNIEVGYIAENVVWYTLEEDEMEE